MNPHSFLFQAMIYLAAAVIMVPLAKKTGLGSVLGYLLAGVLIGPFVLGFIGHEGEDLLHFAEFGVVMMLFIIGLELEPELLWKLRKPIIGLGGLQVLISSLLLAGTGWFFGMNWQSAIALGMILSLSSTAIILQTLTEKGLMKSAAGQSAFSVLLFQDIAVIPMLAILPLLATYAPVVSTGEAPVSTWVSVLPGWGHTLVTLGSVVSIIVGGRYIVKPIFRMVAATRLREVFTATALLLIVGIAVLMTQVGLSPALGTFLAGVVLANSEYRHELESDIEPFKGLLLGLFFLAVGASINFTLILQHPAMIIGLVVMLMIIKGLVLFLLGKIFKLAIGQNMIFAFALSQVGEFAFVLFSFASKEGVLPQDTVDTMVAVVAISMVLTPLLIMLNEKIFLPKLGTKETAEEKEPDAIDESNPVIIAGFGHFGSTIGRFLRAHDVHMTILELDSDRVELLRKMGFKVYYGDPSRYDLLHAAGAGKAKLIIIAIDDPGKRLEMIETIKKHFPDLRMLVRSSNRIDAYDQMNAGMLHVYRESLDTALRLGVDAMKFLGYRAYSAHRSARTFFKLDEYNLKKLASIREEEQYINAARELIEELEDTIKADRQNMNFSDDAGWDEEGLIKDATQGNLHPAKKT
ncbi:MAG: Kef-type potassium/proton antiporter, family [Ferruginibacter sp.]|nr:Kef-type potassium/proton antiporter, family [Ferruginibacter sp.]